MQTNTNAVRAEVLDEARRRDFVSFLARVFETVSPGDTFVLN